MLMGSPAWSQSNETELCSLSELYYLVQIEALRIVGLPETAKFPELSDIKVKQNGIGCSFEMPIKFTVEDIEGEVSTFEIMAKAYRLYDRQRGILTRPEIDVKYLSQK
tara:strand:- start:237 stop:560 length:324 start_codon:yes stop_codon:yes gene_type:complete